MSTANMAIDPGKARAISDYLAANPDATNRDAAAALGIHESAVRRAKAARGIMVELALSVIRTDGGTQFREAVNEDVAAEYAEAYKAGDRLPAPVVFEDGEGHRWLGDGFTRLRAAGLAGLDRLEFELRKGSLEDAILYAAGANERHGQRRTKADRQRAIRAAIELKPNASNEEIGKICNVSRETVRLLRREKFELKPDPLPPEPVDEPTEVPHRPAKNQPELPLDSEDLAKIADDLFVELDSEEELAIEMMGEVYDKPISSIPATIVIAPRDDIEVEETSPDGGPIDEFASWLAGLPLSGKLQGSPLTQFNADARLYWEFSKNPAFTAFGDHVAKFLKAKTGGLVRQAVERFKNNLTHPRDWMTCAQCSGAGCQSCHHRGYYA